MKRDETTGAIRQLHVTEEERIADLSKAARVWLLCETLGARATREEVVAAARKLGVRERVARNNFNSWRYARMQAQRASALPSAVRRQIVAFAHHAAA